MVQVARTLNRTGCHRDVRRCRVRRQQAADDLFRKAKKLMAEKKYAEACPKFEESYRLDPGIGGELNIAKCLRGVGQARRRIARI